jgi:hypothetical protein
MMNSFVYMIAAALSGVIGAALLWWSDKSVGVWAALGYLFVGSIWMSSWWVRRHAESRRTTGQWAAQVAISLLWWPAAIVGGFLGLFAAQPFSLSPLAHSVFMYGFASVIAIGLGVLSLRVDGAHLAARFFSFLICANAAVCGAGLLVYNRFQNPPYGLSNHYESWLILILFVPLAVVNGGLYGSRFPEVAKPFDSASDERA